MMFFGIPTISVSSMFSLVDIYSYIRLTLHLSFVVTMIINRGWMT
jgi:hypothetical protein